MTFPTAPVSLPGRIPELISEMARLWAETPERPCPPKNVLHHWDQLIDEWSTSDNLPLYVRKAKNNRGSIVTHATSGRSIVPTDNRPAQWAFVCAINGYIPNIAEIQTVIRQDTIPIAMIMNPAERASANYRCTLSKSVSPNTYGWKVCHVEGVGLANRRSLNEIDETVLQQHFRRLMSPSNMFVIPLKYAGLGELTEFCQEIIRVKESF